LGLVEDPLGGLFLASSLSVAVEELKKAGFPLLGGRHEAAMKIGGSR
jgi:hypothetical protein